MKLRPPELAALRLMASDGAWRSARGWRELGMPAAGIRLQVLASLGMAERKGGSSVLYRISEAGRALVEEES